MKILRTWEKFIISTASSYCNKNEIEEKPVSGCPVSILTLTRPIGLPPHAPVLQKSADQRWLISNPAKIGIFFV